MDAYVTRTPRTESPPPPPQSASVDLQQALDEPEPNSPAPPPAETLGDRLCSSAVAEKSSIASSSDFEKVSSTNVEIVDEYEALILRDIVAREDDEEAMVQSSPDQTLPIDTSILYNCDEEDHELWQSESPKASAPHLDEPWSSAGDTKSLASPSEEGPSHRGKYTEIGPSVDNEIQPHVGAGLSNLGNTCFLNAVLQCFTHTVPLLLGLCSSRHPLCDRDNEGYCVLCAVRGHIELSLSNSGGFVSPLNIADNLSHFSSTFRRYYQEDAHEFLQCLLDRLDRCYEQLKRKNMGLYREEDNLVKKVFGGGLISKLRCCNCNHCSDTYEPLIDLSLEIEDVDTLPSALESFTKVEKIGDADTKITCENCKEKVSKEKQLMLDQVPSVAALHLKRFKNDGFNVEKIDRHVEFPLELDLLPYTNDCQDKNVDLKYELYAIVVHTGHSSNSGHYHCFIRTAPNTWYQLDDSLVTRVLEEEVLAQEAYILFYVKQGTPWFSTFMEAQKPPSLDPKVLHTSPKSVLDTMDNNNHTREVDEARDVAADGASSELCYGSRYGVSTFMANNPTREVDETRDAAADGASSESRYGSRCGVATFMANDHTRKVDETRDAAAVGASSKPCYGSRYGVDVSRATDGSQREAAADAETSYSHDATPFKVDKIGTPIHEGYYCNRTYSSMKNSANVTPQMPPRSPSPDIYCDEVPEVSCSVVRPQQTKASSSSSCQRQVVNKGLADSKTKQVNKLLKSMPNSRSAQLLAAIKGSPHKGNHRGGARSEGSINKKRPRKDSSPTSGGRVKANLSTFMGSPVPAGNFR